MIKITEDDKQRAYAESRYKFEADQIAFQLAAKDEGLKEGIKEGHAIGLKDGFYQTARAMLKENIPDDFQLDF